jgi:hypothetical protein
MRLGSFVVHHKSKKPETEKKKLPDPGLFFRTRRRAAYLYIKKKKGARTLTAHTQAHLVSMQTYAPF